MKKLFGLLASFALALGLVTLPVGAAETTTVASEAELLAAIAEGKTHVTLSEDIVLTQELFILNLENALTIDGNENMITSGSEFKMNLEGQVHLVKIQNSNVTLKDVTLKTTADIDTGNAKYQHVLDVYAADVTLDNVTLDHSESAKSGAPLVINGGGEGEVSNVAAKGTLTMITGEKSWYAANVDEKSGTASLDLTQATVELGGMEEKNVIVPSTNATVEGLDELAGGFYGVAEASVAGEKYLTFEQALAAAIAQEETTVTLLSDVEVDEMVFITDLDDQKLVIDGNDYTITASDNYVMALHGQINLLKVQNSDNVTLKDVTLKTTELTKHTLDIYNADVVLENVTLDNTLTKGGAPLMINGGNLADANYGREDNLFTETSSTVTATGTLTLVTGEKSWYAGNVDNKGGTASLVVSDATVVFEGDEAKAVIVPTNNEVVEGLEKVDGVYTNVHEDHDLKVVGAKEATCTEDGYTGDKVCQREGCTYIEEGQAIPALGHSYDKDGKCSECGANKTPVATGDNNDIMLYAGLSVVAVTVMAALVLLKKKENC